MIILSTSIRSAYSEYGFIIMMEEEEKKLTWLKKRLVATRRLWRPSSPHIGFSYGTPRLSAILQRSVGKNPQGIHLGNSHDHGAYPWWRSAEFLIPFGRSWTSGSLCIRGLLGFQKGALEQVYVHEGTLEGFWSMIAGGAHQQRNTIRNPVIQVFHSWMCKRILGEWERQR
jgi:hypothetical protein